MALTEEAVEKGVRDAALCIECASRRELAEGHVKKAGKTARASNKKKETA